MDYDLSKRTVSDAVDENSPTSAMYPRRSSAYCFSDRRWSIPIEDSIDSTYASIDTLLEYNMTFLDLPRVKVKLRLAGQGIFVLEDVEERAIFIEY